MSCIFCRIVAGEVPAAKVHEDDGVLAFLDVNPLREGHTLVIPKRHAQKLAELDTDEAGALMATARRLTPVLCRTVDAPDATLAIHDGPAAGQEVPHLHLHIIPRRPADGGGPIHKVFTERPEKDPDGLQTLATRLRTALQ